MPKNKLTLNIDTYFDKLSTLIASGVTFEAIEVDGKIVVTFNGGY